MSGFDAIYKQTVTMFNRITADNDDDFFIPTVLEGVHLVIDHSNTWNSYGGQQADNVRLHVRYTPSGSVAMVGNKRYYEPKEWRGLTSFDDCITFRYGSDNDFDFFVKGVYVPEFGSISNRIMIGGNLVSGTFIVDDFYERHGFYNHLNKMYDHVFAITTVSQYNLLPHFEIMAR